VEWLKQLFTGKDNNTHDLGRYSWALSMSTVIAAAAANWFHGHEIDLQALANAIGVVVGAHGLALWAKKDTEPTP